MKKQEIIILTSLGIISVLILAILLIKSKNSTKPLHGSIIGKWWANNDEFIKKFKAWIAERTIIETAVYFNKSYDGYVLPYLATPVEPWVKTYYDQILASKPYFPTLKKLAQNNSIRLENIFDTWANCCNSILCSDIFTYI